MAEFKVNDAIFDEISAIKSAGDALSSETAEIETEGVSSLKTSVRFIAEHKAIKELLKLYQELVAKEATDLNEMVNAAIELDENLARK